MPTKFTQGSQSMYELYKVQDGGTGALALDGSTGDLSGFIYFKKPQKAVSVGLKITGAVTGSGNINLVNSDDDIIASLAITSGASGVINGTEVYPTLNGTTIPAGTYNFDLTDAVDTGDGVPFVLSKEAFDESVDD